MTVELYGHALHEVSVGRMKEWQMLVIVFGALVGAILYIQINRALEAYFEAQAEQEIEEAEEEAAVSRLASYSSMANSDDQGGKAGPTVPQSEPALGLSMAKSVLIRSRSSFNGGVHTPLASMPLMRHSEAGPRVHRGVVASLNEIKELQARNKAKMHWKKLRVAVKQMFLLNFLRKKVASNSGRDDKSGQYMEDLMSSWQQTKDQVAEVEDDSDNHALMRAKLVAYSLFLGLVVDGIPEGILMGFLAAEGHLSPVFVVSLFVANFPEAFSSASLLVTAKMSYVSIVGMWTGLTVLVGLLAGMSCWLIVAFNPRVVLGEELPPTVQVGVCLTEGITGGAMIACIASVMLPEAFERCSKHGSVFQSSGFICVCGFLMAVTMKTLGG